MADTISEAQIRRRSPGDSLLGRRCPSCAQFSFRRNKGTVAALSQAFTAGDTIVTFNYDALLESVLARSGKWHFPDGCGFHIETAPQRLKLLGSRLAIKLSQSSPIIVLKAHGSVNWMQSHEDDAIGLNYLGLLFDLPIFSTYLPDREKSWHPDAALYLAEDGIFDDPNWPHTRQVQMLPTYRKAYDDKPYRAVWDRIWSAIKNATAIIVAGCRLPEGDAAARALIAQALSENATCKTVTVISPDDPATSEWPAFLDAAGKCATFVQCRFEDWLAGRGRPADIT